ncbi:bifunctional cobalt-precorrin-7 (C(5))-methyltransferase/cobalt-precorrin-6B (C(15))-methyltransferase [Mycobacterium sp. ACS4331]|uniref:bifunctional cobalt-precorrin-7 (C(5))-methyltransferase/cobalt-precorrin-6B (C(15))-methyltransferase n=1 Tax=Mycobacterium sp. ACS4331 TaxID=1834121 RepID=UPI0008004E13|nr:bifunctional cobalt-precorrin-7 (C(5))-methyltransferase/cobalt-precorrin-6B (C(15))-methyltransferase [Mycobacterium sp. ACS4331]OBF11752.1 precorrin-6Y-methylase [Mycobacterium sp. ACS4331]
MIVVVGIGADGVAGLSERARGELSRATVVFGAPRQLALLDASVRADRREWPSPLLAGLRGALENIDGDVHVVASGDPMLHGIGTTLVTMFGADQVRVLPHVSSVSLACAALGWAVPDTEVISLVTAPPHTAVRRGGRAIVLSRDGSTPATLATLLAETGRGPSGMTILEQLGGAGERMRTATAAQWAAEPPSDVDALNVVAVEYQPDDRVLTTLPDDAYAHDGQLTKQPMRALTLAALAPRPNELLWDVGSGSGSIAIEWCRHGNGCRAVAFERDEVRRARVTANVSRFGVPVQVRGAAPDEFAGASPPSAVFIGGGLTQPGLFDGCFAALAPGGRLIANAVTAESESFLVQRYSELGGELRRFQHYRGEPVGGFTGWRPAMPVTQWTVVKA